MTPTDEYYMIVALERRWEDLKAKIDNEMSRIKGVGMTVAYNKVLHMMKEMEELEKK